MAYEVAFVFALYCLAYYFFSLADSFKVEGENAKKALLSGILNMLLRMMSVATVTYSVFFLRLILQDQIQTATMTNILNVYDTYISLFLYGFVLLFFLFYFLHQFVTLVSNFKIHKENTKSERKYG